MEQTSSEITAKYKASLLDGNKIADITGGFGIDSYFFSDKFKEVHHFELNKDLSEIAAYNFSILNKQNIKCFPEDGLHRALKGNYDVVYSDPSRRHESKGKMFFLKDCEPNIPFHLSALLKQTKKLLIKTSPMLDIAVGLKELLFVAEIHIVAVNNEVKELLWLMIPKYNGKVKIKTINLKKTANEIFNFNINDNSVAEHSCPKKFLYEPNAAIMKSGAFDLIAERFNVQKLHKHTHLYTNDKLIDFPGRKFKINKVIPYQKKNFKKLMKLEKANISIRNFPESVSNLRKKLKIKDGGDEYLFFTTREDNKKIIIAGTKV